MVQIDLTRTWEILGEITGDTVHESLIDQLFSQFCLENNIVMFQKDRDY